MFVYDFKFAYNSLDQCYVANLGCGFRKCLVIQIGYLFGLICMIRSDSECMCI